MIHEALVDPKSRGPDFDNGGPDTADLCLDADGTLKTVHAVFDDFDVDKSGTLDLREFRKLMNRRLNVDLEMTNRIWNDTCGPDASIDFEEFKTLWIQIRDLMQAQTN